MMAERRKRIMLLNRRAPYGTIYGQEGLELALVAAAFDQDVWLVFMDDGVYRLRAGQDPGSLGLKNYGPTHRALGDFGITRIYVEQESLIERGLDPDNLMELGYEDEDGAWCPSLVIVTSEELGGIIEQQDAILQF